MRFLLFVVSFVLCCLVGCGEGGPTTHPVSGSVTLDGTPVPDGDIIFVSPDASSHPGMGKIKDGKYEAKVTAGKKKVEINANKMVPLPEGKTGAMGEKEMPENYIPDKYNTKTELTIDITSGQNKKDFTLDSK